VTFLLFFRNTPRGQTDQPILTQNGPNDVDSRTDVSFAVKKSKLFVPFDPQAPKTAKICPILVETTKFSLDFALNIVDLRSKRPYYSSEPIKSAIVNRQRRGEKLKYGPKFYIGVQVT